MFVKREEAAQHLEEADEPQTPEKGSPNKSGEWREMDSGMEWVVPDSAEKSKPGPGGASEGGIGSRKVGKNGDDKDLDDEETFTKGRGLVFTSVVILELEIMDLMC